MSTGRNSEDLVEMLKQLQLAGDKKKPLKGAAKWITLTILVLAFGVGVVGSFNVADFNMDSYVKFLESFAWFFGPLVISIGVGTSAKTITEKLGKGKEKETELTPEELFKPKGE